MAAICPVYQPVSGTLRILRLSLMILAVRMVLIGLVTAEPWLWMLYLFVYPEFFLGAIGISGMVAVPITSLMLGAYRVLFYDSPPADEGDFVVRAGPKTCPSCALVSPRSASHCDCGHVFR